MAETYHAHIAPHCYCGLIVGAASAQLSACSPNFLVLESIKQWDGFHGALLKKKIEWDDGYVIPSKEPGLGVELNEEVAEAHPWGPTWASASGNAAEPAEMGRVSENGGAIEITHKNRQLQR